MLMLHSWVEFELDPWITKWIFTEFARKKVWDKQLLKQTTSFFIFLSCFLHILQYANPNHARSLDIQMRIQVQDAHLKFPPHFSPGTPFKITRFKAQKVNNLHRNYRVSDRCWIPYSLSPAHLSPGTEGCHSPSSLLPHSGIWK